MKVLMSGVILSTGNTEPVEGGEDDDDVGDKKGMRKSVFLWAKVQLSKSVSPSIPIFQALLREYQTKSLRDVLSGCGNLFKEPLAFEFCRFSLFGCVALKQLLASQ